MLLYSIYLIIIFTDAKKKYTPAADPVVIMTNS